MDMFNISIYGFACVNNLGCRSFDQWVISWIC